MCQYVNMLHPGDQIMGKNRSNLCSHVPFSPLKGEQHESNNCVNECKLENVSNTTMGSYKVQDSL